MSHYDEIVAGVDGAVTSNSLPEDYTRPLLRLVESRHEMNATPPDTEGAASYALAHLVAVVMTLVGRSGIRRVERHRVMKALQTIGCERFHEERQGRVLANAPIWRLAMRAAAPSSRTSEHDVEFSASALHMVKRAAEAYLGELLEHAVTIARSQGRDVIQPSDIKTVCSVQLLRPVYFSPYT